jgi:hypothetical protein
VNEVQLIGVVSDLDFKVRNVAFEAKVFNRYDTFDGIANRNKKTPGYAYLYCNLLNRVVLIIIILRVKSLHINMHEQYLQKCMFMKVNFFGIKSKSKREFEKADMHVVNLVELTTIMSPITTFELELVPMFFHMDSINEFRSFLQS